MDRPAMRASCSACEADSAPSRWGGCSSAGEGVVEGVWLWRRPLGCEGRWSCRPLAGEGPPVGSGWDMAVVGEIKFSFFFYSLFYVFNSIAEEALNWAAGQLREADVEISSRGGVLFDRGL